MDGFICTILCMSCVIELELDIPTGLDRKSPPLVTAEDMGDQSKRALVKAINILQILGLVIQIIARSFERLATKSARGHGAGLCCVRQFTTARLWHKPQDVNVPVCIDMPPHF